ncbi:MAG TPA: secondary thiamine-phosphate synthase enzyme YjbQ [Bdellovibrionota bacterium]|nr:secondary thiamine-phosphate synthase enzyme YjbQ [Bdellovibrionota bacterium]
MTVKSIPLELTVRGSGQIENLTKQVKEALTSSRLKAGIVTVFVRHTTASIMIIEDEPGLRSDTNVFWERLIPKDPALNHNTLNAGEDNGHSHLRGQLQGQSVTVPFNDGALSLGRWQEIVMIDFDTRPRARQLIIQFIGE